MLWYAAGYHYINLKNELNQPLLLPSLLVKTEAQDYIPNEHQGEGTTTPTMHLSPLLLVLHVIVIIESVYCLQNTYFLF